MEFLTDPLFITEETRVSRKESIVAKSKTGINKSEFCRNHINKVSIKNASLETMREAWKAAGHTEEEPSSALFYQQAKKIRDGHKARGLKAAASRAASKGPKVPASALKAKTPKSAPKSLLVAIEHQLEELTASAEALKSTKLANACRQARRQAGAEILAAG